MLFLRQSSSLCFNYKRKFSQSSHSTTRATQGRPTFQEKHFVPCTCSLCYVKQHVLHTLLVNAAQHPAINMTNSALPSLHQMILSDPTFPLAEIHFTVSSNPSPANHATTSNFAQCGIAWSNFYWYMLRAGVFKYHGMYAMASTYGV